MKEYSPIKQREIIDFQESLKPYAYHIIGDQMAAEDVVQEVLNGYLMSSRRMDGSIRNERNYLIKSVINRAVNEKKRLIRMRDQYPGEWLPSPVMTENDIYASLDRGRIISYSLMIMMEKLTVLERAVFLLKELYSYSHAEVSELLVITIEYSRQALRRARVKLQDPPPEKLDSNPDDAAMIDALTTAITSADLESLTKLLHDQVEAISDGGPRQSAARKIVLGQDNVSRLLQAIYGKYFVPGTKVQFTSISHQPALLFRIGTLVYRCIVFKIKNNRFEAVYIMVNPDKLQGLQPSQQ